LLGFFALALDAHSDPPMLHGELSVHDPSSIVNCAGGFWLFSTGMGLRSLHSKDLTSWEAGPRVFANPPNWTTNIVPRNKGYFWAPDIIHIHNQYFLYYSVSTWGSQTSVIGLATSPTLDPAAANFVWTDRGPVIQSNGNESFNAIDPSVLLDDQDRLWLAFGSYWSGLKLVELDPQSGLRSPGRSTVFSLAWHESIEAACLYRHDGYYYLFANWGQCCRGVRSTYNIRVGRSKAVTGPYLDREGIDMLLGGGTLFLASEGKQIGPGHAAFLKHGGKEWLSYHYYDASKGGASALAVRRLKWSTGGWPEVSHN
jgi:arabinan endo-1,5-alpha-L-arabinosidase